jgi:hypothetical protein
MELPRFAMPARESEAGVSSRSSSSPIGVRVATLNLWGRRGAWAERRAVLIDGFSRTPAGSRGVSGSGQEQRI